MAQAPGLADASPRGLLSLAWRHQLADHGSFFHRPQEFSVPEIDSSGGRVFAGSSDGRLVAARVRDGRVLWTARARGAIAGRPLYIPRLGLVFVGSDDGNLYAFDAGTGKEAWHYATNGTVRRAPSYDAGVLYFTSSEDRVYAIEAKTGRWRWQYERDRPDGFTIHGESGAKVAGDRVYAGFSDGSLVALDARAGEVLWVRSLAAGVTPEGGGTTDADGTPVADPVRGLVYASSHPGGVYALDVEDGAVRWRRPIAAATGVAFARAPAGTGADDRLYATSSEEGVIALDPDDGAVLWRQVLRQGIPSVPVVGDALLFVSTSEGGLLVIDRATGRLGEFFAPGGGVSAEAVVGAGAVFFVSNSGWLYAARLRARAPAQDGPAGIRQSRRP